MADGSPPHTPDLKYCNEFWRRLIIVLVAVSVTVPVVVKSRPRERPSSGAAFLSASSVMGYGRITGDVRHPGIYPVTANTVTGTVILMAVPVRNPQRYLPTGCDAVRFGNGVDLRVRIDPDGTTSCSLGVLPTAQRLVLGIPLDINSMDEADFVRVPGIGPVLAGRIVAYRQNNGGLMATHELLAIEGVGEKKYSHLLKFFK